MKHKIFPAEQSLINTAADGETPGELALSQYQSRHGERMLIEARLRECASALKRNGGKTLSRLSVSASHTTAKRQT